jgi:SAM-dependent methyltransferase
MMDYNDAMSGGSGPAQRSGWRRSVEQSARFEYALSGWDWSRIERVLDLGCATGELAAWMKRTGRSAEYVGIDLRDDVIEEARRRHPEARFINGDLYGLCDGDLSADLTVGIGTLIDGRPPADERDRRRRLGRLIRAVVATARVGGVVMALNQDVVHSRASLRLEPAVFGAKRSYFERTLEDSRPAGWQSRVTGNFLSTDLVGVLWSEGWYAPRAHPHVQKEACRAALDVGDTEDGDEAWLWRQVDAEGQSSTKESN